MRQAARPAEGALHCGIGHWHQGAAVVEDNDENAPDATKLKQAEAHFREALREFAVARGIVPQLVQLAQPIKGSTAFVKRQQDVLGYLDTLETATKAIAAKVGAGQLPTAQDCYEAVEVLSRLAIRTQENSHAYRQRKP